MLPVSTNSVILIIIIAVAVAVRPPPPPHPPPDPPASTSETQAPSRSTILPSNPSKLLPSNLEIFNTSGKQCSFGAELSFVSFADSLTPSNSDQLFANLGAASPCSGVIDGWSVCYQSNSSSNITFLVLRYNQVKRHYSIMNIHSVGVNAGGFSSPVCDHFQAEREIFVSTGDVFGFLLPQNMRITLAQAPEGNFKVYQTTRKLVSFSLEEDDFKDYVGDGTIRLVPVISVILNSSDDMVSTTMNTGERTCSERNVGAFKSFSPIEFWSVIVVCSIVAVLLISLSIGMGCCLYHLQCCSKFYHRCLERNKDGVTHIVQVEPFFEQSMQYNDMYVPSGSRTQRHQQEVRNDLRITPNPAYGQGQQNTLQIGVRDELCSSRILSDVPTYYNSNAVGKSAAFPKTTDTRRNQNLAQGGNGQKSDMDHIYESVKLS